MTMLYVRIYWHIILHWLYTHGTTQLIYALVYPAIIVGSIMMFFGVSFQTVSIVGVVADNEADTDAGADADAGASLSAGSSYG